MPHEWAFAGPEGFKRLVERIAEDPDERSEVSTAKEIVSLQVSQLAEAHKVDTSTAQVEVQIAEQTEALWFTESEKERAVLAERLKEAQGTLLYLDD